jgi:hypothetical protein
MMNRITLYFKQRYCDHSITNDLQTQIVRNGLLPQGGPLLIVSAIIKCTKCNKTFPLPNNHPCCYMRHLQGEMLKEQFIQLIKNNQQ